jgi:hypothetical protein
MTSIAQFTQDLQSLPVEDVVKRHVFTDEPHVFRGKAKGLSLLRQHLGKHLNVPESNIVVVGSAQTGFSLAPDSFPRAFHAGSDIDIAVIDQGLFDMMWHTILKWHYPRREAHLPDSDWQWRIKRSNDVYWGWFVPDQIRYDGLSFPAMLKPLRDISTIWFNAFRSLGRLPEFASRDVSGRLYRTWDHATMYHAEGLRLIVQRLTAKRGTTT